MRGELFTTGRYYLSGSVLVEMTPLLQFIGTYSLAQNFDLPASFNLPAGPDGSVFGGLFTNTADGRILRLSNALFAHLTWYC